MPRYGRNKFAPAPVHVSVFSRHPQFTMRPTLHARAAFLFLAAGLSLASGQPAADTTPAPAIQTPAIVAPPAENDSVPPALGSVRLTGANGRSVDFAGIWEARPEGLLVVTDAEAALQLVPWDRFDLKRLKTDQPALDAARQRARFLRSAQPVNLGLFAGLLTPGQAGAELRRVLDTPLTVKVPLTYRTTTKSTSSTTLVNPPTFIYDGIVLQPSPDSQPTVAQTNRTVTETRQSPDELTTSPRRVLMILANTDNVSVAARRALLELIKDNPVLTEELAGGLERIAASIPPRHLLANDPTILTLAYRLREYATAIRGLSTTVGLDFTRQMQMRDLLLLAEHPVLR